MEAAWRRVHWFASTPGIGTEHARISVARQLRPYGSAAKSRWPSSSSHSHAEWHREGRGGRGASESPLAEILKALVSQKSITEHLESCARHGISVFPTPDLLSTALLRWSLHPVHVGKPPKSSSPVIYRFVDVRWNPFPLSKGRFARNWRRSGDFNFPSPPSRFQRSSRF